MMSLLLSACLCCSGPSVDSIPPTPPPPPLPPERKDMIFSNPIQEMPYPLSCDSLERRERRECMNEVIPELIYSNLRWPKNARENCVEGTAVISFTVTKAGDLDDFIIARDPGAGTGEEALRIVKLMAAETSPWHPGTYGVERKPVEMRYHIPVRFKLE